MATSLVLAAEAPPPPMPEHERRASEDLLRRVDEAIATLRQEAEGLSNARELYRQRLEGPGASPR